MLSLKKTAWPWLLLSLIIIGIDQLTKYFVLHHFIYNHPQALLPFLNITLRYNTGSAFGFLSTAGGWQLYLLSAISIVVACVLIGWLLRTPRRDWLMACSISLIIGGALGNLIDRLRLSYVIDFIDFHLHHWHFATFNIADSAISVGAFLLVLRFLFFTNSTVKSSGS